MTLDSPVRAMDASASPTRTRSSLAAGGVEITREIGDSAIDTLESMPHGEAFVANVQLSPLERKTLWRGNELALDGVQQGGDLLIADLRDRWRRRRLSSFDNVCFRIPLSALQSFAEDAGRPEFRTLSCRPGVADEVMLGLARALVPSFEHPREPHPLFLEQINLAMLAHLIQAYGGVYFSPRKKGVLTPRQQKRAIELMVAHIGKPLSIAELAAACELSRSYFVKAFKESFARTPHLWLTEYRIARAKELLCLGMPIAKVAFACGFADQSHLTRAFAAHVGVSPGQCQRDARLSSKAG
jgi:AraC-like DNA-binding protein